jgi:hypothetical protein
VAATPRAHPAGRGGLALIRAAVIAVSLLSTACAQYDLPAGWRLPQLQEIYASDNQAGPWRDEDPDRYLVARGDFDGDGRDDHARLLVSADGKTYALFIFWASGSVTQLDSMDAGFLEVLGIKTLPPGRYRTVCGKGYRACEKGEPETLDLRYPGIDYFQEESADSVFYWSPSEKAFRRIWLSD